MQNSKKYLTILYFIIGILLISKTFSAIEDISNIDEVNKKIEDVQDIKNKLSDEDVKTEYLKEQWINLLSKNKLGIFLISLEKEIEPINPLIKFLFGIKFSWSWLFIITFVIWMSIGIFTSRLLTFFTIFSKTLRYIISIIIAILFSYIGLTILISEVIVNRINSLPTLWLQIIAILILIFFLFYFSMYSKFLERLFIKIKERKEKNKMEKDIKKLKKEIKSETKKDTENEEIGREVLEEIGKKATEE